MTLPDAICPPPPRTRPAPSFEPADPLGLFRSAWEEARRRGFGKKEARETTTGCSVVSGRRLRPIVDDLFEPFESEQVPGFCDGDYPPWLQKEMGGVLPAEIVSRFCRWEATCINGHVLRLEEKYRPRVIAMLLRAGYEVVRREDLMFW